MPRRWSTAGLIQVGILLTAVLLSSCTSIKYSLYDMALGYERKKAGLVPKQIDVNGKTIAFLESDGDPDRPAFVLLHGFAANKENWIRFAGYLTDTYRVVAVDLPGHGESVKDANLRYDIDDQVRYLNEVVTRLGLKRFHLAGNSMGGAISSLYAATYPDQLGALFLFAPGGIYEHEAELHRLLREGKNPLIVKTADDFDALMDFALEKKPFIPWPITSVLAEKAVSNRAINERIFSDIRGDHAYDFKEALKRVAAPTLIIWGKEDRVLAVENADEFAKLIPNSRTVILDGIGHAPMIEVPERSAGLCEEFLASRQENEG